MGCSELHIFTHKMIIRKELNLWFTLIEEILPTSVLFLRGVFIEVNRGLFY